MSEYICGNVICPFFKDVNSAKKKIICEGIEKGSLTIQVFGKKDALERHMESKCCHKYPECRIAKMLYEKYPQ